MKLFDHIKSIFERTDYFYKDGKIFKNKVVEAALKLDSVLLSVLLKDEKAKSTFFEIVDGIFVFDKVKFQKFVSNKEFLPDSYTSFKNKIGLTANGEYLTEASEVVLDFPFKDCVLKGGQTKEDQKNQEIFWNQTLAKDEIDLLFSPKIFTNWQRVNNEQRSEVLKLSIKDNLIIKGNNLIALHSIKPVFTRKIKLIYIDPPYNTGNDGFNYNDSFNHSSWLTFMKNRLEVSKELLRDDGVIFVHIGDEEMHYLKVLMDDIFGRDSFVGTIPRKTRSGKSDVPFRFSQDFDWILVYTKEKNKKSQLFKRSIERKYYQSSDFPNDAWRLNPITTQRTILERPNSDFTMINPKNGQEFPVNPNRSWAVTKNTFEKYYNENKIVFPGDYDFLHIKSPMLRVFKSDEIDKKGDDYDKAFFSSDQININMENLLKKTQNKKGTEEIISLFGRKSFSYPKNELLLKTIIESCTKEGDIVLDFHLGSGTTAAVAHKMKRQYIGIEQMDYIEEIAVKRLEKVIAGSSEGVSNEVVWNGGGDFVYAELFSEVSSLSSEFCHSEDHEKLIKILQKLYLRKTLLRYDFCIEDEAKILREFKKLNLEEKKHFLLSLIDKNNFYVAFSEIEDVHFNISDYDKKINYDFYSLKNISS